MGQLLGKIVGALFLKKVATGRNKRRLLAFTLLDMTPKSQQTDEDRRFADWGREHAPAVRGYLWAAVRRADLADDLTQEVFFRAWRARRKYREEGNARAYLLRIADRLVCDRGRKAGREITLNEEGWKRNEPLGAGLEPHETLVRSEVSEQLGKALELLSPIQRRVLLLRYFGQLSFRQIAEIIDCPLGTTLSHCHRALTTLRGLLVEENP